MNISLESVLGRCLSNGVKFRIWSVLAVFLIFFIGCKSQGIPSIIEDENTLPTQIDGASDKTIVSLEKKFKNRGVRIISMGQNYLISIPSAALFYDESPRLTIVSYDVLNDVACYLRQFRHVGITVTGYTIPYVSRQREHVLSLSRARVVANYLMTQGIETRFIFTAGMGNDKPIVGIDRRGDGAANSRVEITFREIIS